MPLKMRLPASLSGSKPNRSTSVMLGCHGADRWQIIPGRCGVTRAASFKQAVTLVPSQGVARVRLACQAFCGVNLRA